MSRGRLAGWLLAGCLMVWLVGPAGPSWLAVLVGFGLFWRVAGLPGAGTCIGGVAAPLDVQWPVWGYES